MEHPKDGSMLKILRCLGEIVFKCLGEGHAGQSFFVL